MSYVRLFVTLVILTEVAFNKRFLTHHQTFHHEIFTTGSTIIPVFHKTPWKSSDKVILTEALSVEIEHKNRHFRILALSRKQ